MPRFAILLVSATLIASSLAAQDMSDHKDPKMGEKDTMGQDHMMQDHMMQDHMMHENHEQAFSQGETKGLTIGAPHLDINGGFFFRKGENGGDVTTPDSKEGLVRFHTQMGLGTPYLALASDLLFLPGVGATPTFSSVVQVQPVKPSSWLFVGGGLGVITGHSGSTDRLEALAQGVVAARLPLHGLAPFVQVGKALRSGEKAEFLFGIAHPLAPYKLHF